MSIKSNFSLLLILVVSQVSSENIKVEIAKRLNEFAERAFQRDIENRLKQVTDEERKQELQKQQAASSGNFYKGVQITYGNPATKTPSNRFTFAESELVCLKKGESVDVLPFFSSSKDKTFIIHVKYDYGDYKDYKEKDFSLKESISPNYSKLCFTVGHFSPDIGFEDLTVHLYLNFFTDMKNIKDKKLLSLSILITYSGALISLYETKETFNEEMIADSSSNYLEQINMSRCVVDKKGKLEFKINDRPFSMIGQGTFGMSFFDEKTMQTSYDEIKINSFKGTPIKQDGSEICYSNFVELMLSDKSRKAYPKNILIV